MSPGRSRLIAAGARPEGFQACLAGILPAGEKAGVDLSAMARAARAIEADLIADPCTRARDLALLRAWTGDLEGALARLDEAGPAAADPWCEAERAAYLAELGERNEDPEALLGAVAAADRALTAAPEQDIARCNRALALERLALSSEARREWGALAEQERSRPLAEIAKRQSAALDAPSPAKRWRDFASRIESSPEAVSRAEIDEAARSMPQAARQLGLEVLLGQAAAAALRGDSTRAEPYLAAAESLGERLQGHSGEATLSRAASEVQQSIAAGPAGAAYLAGVEAYRRGRQLRREERYADAAAELATAVAGLSGSGGALGAWARHAEAVARWVGATREERKAIDWEGMLRETPTDLPALRARCAWSAGVTADLGADLPRALRHFDAAIDELARLGDAEDEAWVRALRAFVLFDLGRDGEAETDLLRALRARGRILSDTTLELILDSWIRLIVVPRWPRQAEFYYEELAEAARSAQRASFTAQALLLRAEHAGATAAERIEYLDAALAASQAIVDPADRQRKLAQIHAARARLTLDSDPQAALDSASEALAGFEARGLEPERLPALRIQARAYLALDRLAEAESALLTAIDVLDRAQDRSDSLEERMRTLLDASAIFEDLAGLRLLRRGDSDGAFEAIELGRARSLLARATGTDRGRTSHAGDPEQLGRRLPRGYELVEFAFIGGRLAIWHLNGRGVRSAVVPADRVAARTAAERLAADLAADREGSSAQAAELGRLLLAPVASWLERGATLIVVPDPALTAIPWPALTDPETGQPLIVSRPVLVAPCARWMAGVAERGGVQRSTDTARVLGDAAFGHEIFPELAALPGSAAEAQSVAALYPGSELLLGERANAAGALAAPLPEVLHLAAHGLAPTHAPERAALVLAPDAAHPAGLLPTPEIAASALRGVELVVLSACASARGPAYGSEGILSLTNAFLAAGVPAVVATSWPVEDAATRELMVAFHRGIAAGLAPSAALRRAQLAAMEEHGSRPSIWAGFAVWGVR